MVKSIGKVYCFLLLGACAIHLSGNELAFDSDNGGIQLPKGFQAVVVADNIGRARQIAVRENGDIYVSLNRPHGRDYVAALRDTDGDGRADVIKYFGELDDRCKGLRLYGDHLFVSSSTQVVRFKLDEEELLPVGLYEVVVSGFVTQRSHRDKVFAFDDHGNLFVEVGAPSNACQEDARSPGSPGIDPCPHLERSAGIWRYKADRIGQTQLADGYHYATGIRNSIAITWNAQHQELYVVQHGRDQLFQLWPELYNKRQGAELPSEEFMLVRDGSNFGWPYAYYDHFEGARMVGPEYGGDGRTRVAEGKFDDPILAFPGHWAPNDILFYTGRQFPEKYRRGAFIAFHGSWNRAPLPQQGYNVVFVPFKGDLPVGGYEIFADGFKGVEVLESPGDARWRPTAFYQGTDGSLYISDSVKGRIWRIVYTGRDAAPTGKTSVVHEKSPAKGQLWEDKLGTGEALYRKHCLACHQANGKGVPDMQPSLVDSKKLRGDAAETIRLILEGSAFIKNSKYDSIMTPFNYLSDEEIATVINYTRSSFANEPGMITSDNVKEHRH